VSLGGNIRGETAKSLSGARTNISAISGFAEVKK